jgi:hypothetical protein
MHNMEGEDKTYTTCDLILRFSGQKGQNLGPESPLFEVKAAVFSQNAEKNRGFQLPFRQYCKIAYH